jgi:hypothetical protein
MLSQRARTGIVIAVTLVWVASFIATLTVDDYHPAESINGAFAAIIAAAFALGKRNGGDGDG